MKWFAETREFICVYYTDIVVVAGNRKIVAKRFMTLEYPASDICEVVQVVNNFREVKNKWMAAVIQDV